MAAFSCCGLLAGCQERSNLKISLTPHWIYNNLYGTDTVSLLNFLLLFAIHNGMVNLK